MVLVAPSTMKLCWVLLFLSLLGFAGNGRLKSMLQLLNIQLHMDNLMTEFALFSTAFLWDNSYWESHCKVFMHNFIHHGARKIVFRALAIPEPCLFVCFCCGKPLVYQGLWKIKNTVDPKRSPWRCNQTTSLQQSLDSTSSAMAERGWGLGRVRKNLSQVTWKDLHEN